MQAERGNGIGPRTFHDDETGLESRPTAQVVASLVANHREFLAFVERRVGDRVLAEEILQAAFVRSDTRSSLCRRPRSSLSANVSEVRGPWWSRRTRRLSPAPTAREARGPAPGERRGSLLLRGLSALTRQDNGPCSLCPPPPDVEHKRAA